MKLRIIALGNENVTRRITDSLAGDEVDLVCQSEVPQALDLLKREKFDLALIDSGMKNVGPICYRITWLCQTSVALIIKNSLTDWSQLRSLDVDGFISEDSGSIEILAQLKAIVRRHRRHFSPARILIIEDDEQIRESLKLCFSIYWPEAEIHTAGMGEEGVGMARSQSMDAILLDLRLPDISGFDVLNQIRRFSPAPVIVLSAARERDDVIKAMAFGADDYVVKPFQQADLLTRIRHHISLMSSMN
jgi:DNA-binding response OmpR family regulator